MVIKPAGRKIIDVFVKDGWENWSRFEIRGTFLKKIGGENLSPHNMTLLKEKVYGK